MSFLVLACFITAIRPDIVRNTPALQVLVVAMLPTAVACFVLPLYGMHLRLVAEKDRPARGGEWPLRDAARAPARTSRRRDPHRRGKALSPTLVGRGGARGDLASLDLALGNGDADGLPHDARPPGADLARAAPARAVRHVSGQAERACCEQSRLRNWGEKRASSASSGSVDRKDREGIRMKRIRFSIAIPALIAVTALFASTARAERIHFSLAANPKFAACLAAFPGDAKRPPTADVSVERGRLNDTLRIEVSNSGTDPGRLQPRADAEGLHATTGGARRPRGPGPRWYALHHGLHAREQPPRRQPGARGGSIGASVRRVDHRRLYRLGCDRALRQRGGGASTS